MDLQRENFFSEQIIDSSRSMITIINRDYRYEKVNRTFCLNQNRPADQIVGHSLEDVWGKENFINSIKNNIDNCFTGKVVYYQAFFETPAWGKRYYEVVLRPVSGQGDSVTHTMAETYDITEIKLKEQAASEIEWEFRNLESNLPIGFFRSDIEGNLLNVNKAFVRILQVADESEVMGHSLREYYSEPELFVTHHRKLLNESLASFGSVNLMTGEGNEIVSRLSAFVVHDGSGNPVYIDGAIEDFTRETDLEKKLLQTQKLDTIGLLAGGIAHDFNTILTTIYGYSELSLEGLDPSSEAYHNIKKIIQAVGRARSLTGQILTFSRQVGQQRITVNVNDILQETIGFLKPSVAGNITVEELIVTPDIEISADPTQLFRVFINLANNALQSMEDTGGRLTLTLDTRDAGELNTLPSVKRVAEKYALVRFADTGPGMDEQVAARIFEPFFTGRETGKGTGLGLSVVYGIISEIEGEIVVSGKKNEGTTIDVLIPLVKPERELSSEIAPRARILLIPGNDNEVNVISLALTKSGYAVESVDPSGNWKVNAGRSDLVIIFDKSPQMSAPELLSSLSEFGVTTPVLMISDFDVWLMAEKELPSGIVKANLFKPVSLKEIIYSIDSLINNPL